MNIAILVPSLGGGGAERVASLIGNYYYDKGHKVYFFLGNYGLRKRYNVKGEIIHCDINFSVKDNDVIDLFRSVKKIRKLKKKYKIDVAISFMEEFNFINVLSRRKEIVIIRVCQILSDFPDIMKSIFLNRHVLGFLYNKADKVIVMSDYAINDMHKNFGVKLCKMRKIPNPVLCNIQSSNSEVWQYGNKTVICVSRFDDEKQQNVAIKAFTLVAKKDKEAQMILLGEGKKRKKIQKMIDKSGVGNRIHLLGFQKDVYFFLKHSRVFLMTSRTEGFPNAMLEAMSVGVPVISVASTGGVPEIIGDVCENERYCRYGILMPYINDNNYDVKNISKEESELADELLNFINNDRLIERYKCQSLKRAKRYHIENVMEQWDKLIFAKRKHLM